MAAAYVSPRQRIMAPFLGTPGVEQSALFESDDEQEREMTASEAEGCFYWPAVRSSTMFPGRYGRRRRVEKKYTHEDFNRLWQGKKQKEADRRQERGRKCAEGGERDC